FQHVQRQSFRFFDNTETGHIMSRMTNDLFDIGELAHHAPEDFFIPSMTFFGAFVIMFTINYELAVIIFIAVQILSFLIYSVIILIAVPILIFLISYSNIKMNKAWRNMYKEIADVNARVEDAVSGVRVVQSFTNEPYEMERFTADNYRFRKAKLVGYKVMAFV